MLVHVVMGLMGIQNNCVLYLDCSIFTIVCAFILFFLVEILSIWLLVAFEVVFLSILRTRMKRSNENKPLYCTCLLSVSAKCLLKYVSLNVCCLMRFMALDKCVVHLFGLSLNTRSRMRKLNLLQFNKR